MNTSSPQIAPDRGRTFSQSGMWAKLNYTQKFTIITLIFALPILAFTPLVYQQLLRIDQYGTKEKQGTIYLRELWKLSANVQKYSRLSESVQNGTASESDLTEAREQVEENLQTIRQNILIAENLGLNFGEARLRANWNEVQVSGQFSVLLDDIDLAKSEVGDKSFLILDPDLDTYYIMDTILLKLPVNQRQLYEIERILDRTGGSLRFDPSELAQLQTALTTLDQNIEAIERGLNVGIESNTNQAIDENVLTAFDEYKSIFSAFNEASQIILTINRPSLEDLAELERLRSELNDSGSAFYDTASERLERGIQNRIDSLSLSITLYVALSIVSITIAFYTGNQLMRSISIPLQETIQAAEQFSAGKLSTRINYISDDEAGKVIQAFNRLAEEVETKQTDLENRSEDLEDKTKKLETISKVSREITSFRDLNSLLNAAANLIHENFGYYHVGIFLVDERKEFAILTAANSAGGKRMLERGHFLKSGETGIVGYVTQTLQARIALDVGSDAVFFNNPDLPETHSEMALPLVVNGQILGVLDVQSREQMAFKQEDIPTLQILAEQLAIAIQNAKLFSEAEKALESARMAFGEQSREAWGKILRSQSKVGYIATLPGTAQIQNDSLEPSIAKAVDTGDLILVPDGLTISIPVKIRGQVIGAIRLKKSEIAEAWTQDETNLAILLADQLSGALESARLYNDSQQRAARESLVSEISSRINASATRDSILRETVQELGQSIGNVSVTFQLLEKSNGENPATDNSRSVRMPSNK